MLYVWLSGYAFKRREQSHKRSSQIKKHEKKSLSPCFSFWSVYLSTSISSGSRAPMSEGSNSPCLYSRAHKCEPEKQSTGDSYMNMQFKNHCCRDSTKSPTSRIWRLREYQTVHWKHCKLNKTQTIPKTAKQCLTTEHSIKSSCSFVLSTWWAMSFNYEKLCLLIHFPSRTSVSNNVV